MIDTTSNDVIHSIWIPSVGVKIDAIPGTINSVIFISKFKGILVGCCAELCGIGHDNMPICFSSV